VAHALPVAVPGRGVQHLHHVRVAGVQSAGRPVPDQRFGRVHACARNNNHKSASREYVKNRYRLVDVLVHANDSVRFYVRKSEENDA